MVHLGLLATILLFIICVVVLAINAGAYHANDSVNGSVCAMQGQPAPASLTTVVTGR